ncbi:MAG: cytochrome c biogenesis protein CcsA [Planctomycetaceae bacterium]|jgi:hypothetical protein|nr:cytochrome c biogenesis protein CcsA [Planctomycetaceae bacterium]
MQGIGVICFAASYAAALLFDVLRFFFHPRLCRVMAVGWLTAGFAAHSIYIFYKALLPVERFLGNEQIFFLVAAWGLVPVCLYFTFQRKQVPFVTFFVPLILVLICFGMEGSLLGKMPEVAEVAHGETTLLWRVLHVVSLLLAFLSLAVAAIAGIMYIRQDRLLKDRVTPSDSAQLPSLEWSGNIARDAIILSQYFLLFGILTGIIAGFSLVTSGQPNPLTIYDPLVFGGLILCVLISVVISKTIWRGLHARERAGLAVMLFIILLFFLWNALLSPNSHWKKTITPTASLQMNQSDGTCHSSSPNAVTSRSVSPNVIGLLFADTEHSEVSR